MSVVAAPAAERPAAADRKFRRDINGLRAIGVGSVVAFHFGIFGLQGGFVGVDVFFVISGYLMTLIIAGGLDRDRFSLLGFYAARVRRLVPALVAMLSTIVIATAALVDPQTAAEVAKAAITSLLFVSNIQYAAASGYFAGAPEGNWLLHTWTLSVEWQFYLLYPIILMLARKSAAVWRHRLLVSLACCAVLFVATMVACAYSPRAMQIGFFLLPTRAWEMLAGGCIAFLGDRALTGRTRRVLSLTGQIAILAAIVVIQPLWPWPSPWMLLPILGTCAVIAANRTERSWLDAAPVQAIGRWSYSIYLWHWPIVAAIHYLGWSHEPVVILLGITASIVLGALSFVLVETRRERTGRPQQRPTGYGVRRALGAAALALAGFAVVLAARGFESVKVARLDPATRAAMAHYASAEVDWIGAAACDRRSRFLSGFHCETGVAGPRTLVVGDSHVEQFIPRFVSRDAGRLTILYRNGCSPLPQLPDQPEQCLAFNRAVERQALSGSYDRVVFIAFWQGAIPIQGGRRNARVFCERTSIACTGQHAEGLLAGALEASRTRFATLIGSIVRRGVQVTIVGPYPTPDMFGDPRDEGVTSPRTLYRETYLSRRPAVLAPMPAAAAKRKLAPVTRYLQSVTAASGARYVDAVDAFCSPTCSAYADGRFLFKDPSHLRASAVKLPMFGYIDQALR